MEPRITTRSSETMLSRPPVGKVFNILFGQASVVWMSKWLTNDQKCTELQMEDKKGLSEDHKTRTYSYIKPLYASIGPKQTKCIVTEQIENIDFEKAVNILCTTQTPDVPSGNIFSVKTKYCLSWAENNATRIQANCTIEWTGKSWLKGKLTRLSSPFFLLVVRDYHTSAGPIEKAQTTARRRTAPNSSPASKLRSRSQEPVRLRMARQGKGQKKRRKGKAAQASTLPAMRRGSPRPLPRTTGASLSRRTHSSGRVVDLIKPLITGNVVYGLLVGLLVATWFGWNDTAVAPTIRERPGLSQLSTPRCGV